jgi:predicted RNA-binding protein YlqC (UPF0109 family)
MKNLPYQEVNTYTDWVENTVLQLVDDANAVDVSEEEDGNNWLKIVIKVARDDKGKMIGKNGSIIGSIHKILIAMSRGKKIAIDIV